MKYITCNHVEPIKYSQFNHEDLGTILTVNIVTT